MFQGQVGANDEYGLLVVQVSGRGQRVGMAVECVKQGGDIARAMMVDIARPQTLAREFLQVEIFLVGSARGSDDAELSAPATFVAAGVDPAAASPLRFPGEAVGVAGTVATLSPAG